MKALLENVLFIDIETATQFPEWESVPNRFKSIWEKKSKQFKAEELTTEELYLNKGAIFAEYGKVIVISIGIFKKVDKNVQFRIKSFHNSDEKLLLEEFSTVLSQKFASSIRFCGHNIKEFDLPYICRRLLIHGLPIPECLELAGKKPWEVPHYDTLEMWKFGDFKHYTSLETLATVFDIPTSKDQIDGSLVNHYYHELKQLDTIKQYCEKDVWVTAQIFCKLKSIPLPEIEVIIA